MTEGIRVLEKGLTNFSMAIVGKLECSSTTEWEMEVMISFLFVNNCSL